MRRFKWRQKTLLKVLLIFVLVITVGLGVYVAYGAYKLKQLASMSFAEMLAYTTKDNKDAIITVGIIHNGQMTYDVYGENGSKLPQAEHSYEIGSLTKTFTTALLCKAISEDRVSLDDSIDRYLSLPSKGYYPTLRRLVTHTSGYKGFYFESPMISNFLHRENDFNGITEDMLLARLGKIKLDDHDYAFRYSNFGLATLGLVLEQLYAEDYTPLMNVYIADELGLVSTMVFGGAVEIDNGWKWSDSDAYIPAGGLVSNITDMMQYARLHIYDELDYLALSHEVLAEVNATTGTYEKMGIRMDAVGAGWMLDLENNIIWHNGGTSNYNCYLGFDKERQIGVVVLSNLPPDYRIPATVMGIEILTSLQK